MSMDSRRQIDEEKGPGWYLGLALWFFFVLVTILTGLFVAATKPELPTLAWPSLPEIPTTGMSRAAAGLWDLLVTGAFLGLGLVVLYLLARLLDYWRERQASRLLYDHTDSPCTPFEHSALAVDGLAYDILRLQNLLFPTQLVLEPRAALRCLQREIESLRTTTQRLRQENEALRQSEQERQQKQGETIRETKDALLLALQHGYEAAQQGLTEQRNPYRGQAATSWLAGWRLAQLERELAEAGVKAARDQQAALQEVSTRLACLFKTDDWAQIELTMRRLTTEHRVAYERLEELRTVLPLDRALPIVEAAREVAAELDELRATCATQQARLAKVKTKRARWKKEVVTNPLRAQVTVLAGRIEALEAMLAKFGEWQVVDLTAFLRSVNYGKETAGKKAETLLENRWGRRFLQRQGAEGLLLVGKPAKSTLPLLGPLEATELVTELSTCAGQGGTTAADTSPSLPPSPAPGTENRETFCLDGVELERGRGAPEPAQERGSRVRSTVRYQVRSSPFKRRGFRTPAAQGVPQV